MWGLLSFVQMASPPIGRSIAFPAGANSTGSASGNAGASGDAVPPPVLIVDGAAMAYFLFQRCETCRWFDGGDLRAFDLAVRDFVRYARQLVRASLLRACPLARPRACLALSLIHI